MDTIIQHGLIYGLYFSVFCGALLLAGALINPESMLNDYPPDIRAAYGPMSERARRVRTLVGIPFLLGVIALLVISVATLIPKLGGQVSFLDVFTSTAIMLMVFNVVDLLILDWLLFVTLQPQMIVLPGTEGMAGYRDYGFHFRAFLRGTVMMLILSLIVAGITVLVV